MENKYFKASKESVWWVIRHLIGMLILYIVYIKFMPFGTRQPPLPKRKGLEMMASTQGLTTISLE